MITVTVAYPFEQGSTFNFDYYEKVHMTLVADRWSGTAFRGSEALRGLAGPDGGQPSFHALALLRFESMSGFEQAISSAAGSEILGDVPNFTSVQPLVQVNETLWDTQERS